MSNYLDGIDGGKHSSSQTETTVYPTKSLKPYKCTIVKKWTVSSDLRSLETFDNCDSNYDVIERLVQNKVLTKGYEDDSEYCQAWLYFKTKSSAEGFVKRLQKYIEKRKEIIKSL